MSITHGLFTSEAVSAGHPDKLCDRISDTILDAFLQRDPLARVACETLAADQRIIVSGEFRTRNPQHFDEVKQLAPALIRQLLRDTGYTSADTDIDPDTCQIELLFNHQSPQIAAAVDHDHVALGAGDQGMMFGYACDETAEFMPLAWSLATELVATATALVHSDDALLRADGKSQVTVRYEQGKVVGVQCVVLSWQHRPHVSLDTVQRYLITQVIDKVVPHRLRTTDFCCLVNPAGAWTLGGPKGDTGVTGRKIIVDSYGGACPHGGGAFSGKDPSKVDRSGAYAARWVARNIVAAGLAQRCTVQLAYAIGHTRPVSVLVDTHGTSRRDDGWLAALVEQEFDLSPAGIIAALSLQQPIYADTAVLGHFGRYRKDCPWDANQLLVEGRNLKVRKQDFLNMLRRKGQASLEGHAWLRFDRFVQHKARLLAREEFPRPLVSGASRLADLEIHHQRLAAQLDWTEVHQCLDDALEYLCRQPFKDWSQWPRDPQLPGMR